MVAAAFDGLRQINRLRERAERLDLLVGDLADVHRRRFLQLHNRDARIDQLLQRLRDVLESDRLMADVEHDAEVAAKSGNGRVHRDAGELCQARCADLPV